MSLRVSPSCRARCTHSKGTATSDGKVIWILNHYAGSPIHGMEYRHFYLARHFKQMGHAPVIVGASFHHLMTKTPERAWGDRRGTVRMDQDSQLQRKSSRARDQHDRLFRAADVQVPETTADTGCGHCLVTSSLRRCQRRSDHSSGTSALPWALLIDKAVDTIGCRATERTASIALGMMSDQQGLL